MATVQDIYRILDAFAPFSTALEFDNVGLLLGRMDRPVRTVLTALDATPSVLEEAKRLDAQLLVTHHPLLFSPVQRLDEDDPEARLVAEMIRADLSMIAAHTNLDMAQGGVNDALVRQLGWQVLLSDAFLRFGEWPAPRTLAEVQRQVADALGWPAMRYGASGRAVSRFAVCSGSGGSEVARAAGIGADVLVTGEIKHSQVLEALALGMAVLEAGHRATEKCAADLLARHLQSAVDRVELRVRVFPSEVDPFDE